MQLNKTKNAARNIVFGSALKIYQLAVPFFMRTVITYYLGVEYLGLSGLFTSIFQVLNLVELGVGSAMIFSMYKPIVDDDKDTICALMRLYLIYYRVIGFIILGIGLACIPFIPYLIHGSAPANINIYVLYLLNLGATVLTYWLFAYKNSILQAYQRQDVVSKINIATDTCKYLLQLGALIYFRNYYYFVIAILISQVLANICTAIASQILYPQYKPKGKLPKEEIKAIDRKIKDLFTSKLGGTIVGSADTIVISAFLGLRILAIYQNYFYILSACVEFIAIINRSVLAGIGNSMITKSIKENYKDFRIFCFIQLWIFGFCICCLSALYQPFMTLWMGEKMLFDYSIVILLCIYFLCNELIQMLGVYKDAAGIWNKDKLRPLVEGLSNLAINLMLVKFIGIYGIVLSTIVSMLFISIPWLTHNIFRLVFKEEKINDFIKHVSFCVGVTIIAAIFVNIICGFIPGNGIPSFVVKVIVCVIGSNLVFVGAYHKLPVFKSALDIAFRMVPIKKRKAD